MLHALATLLVGAVAAGRVLAWLLGAGRHDFGAVPAQDGRMPRLALVLLLLLLAGCAERWTRPGTSEAEADAMNAACADQAALAVPVQNVWTMVDPGGFDRFRRCWVTRAGQEVCDWTPVFRPPRFAWVDANRSPRDAWRRECMRAQGFAFEGYRPLRLE